MEPSCRTETMQQVGERIRVVRKKRGMTQDELAAQISESCSGKMISKYENGMTEMRMLTYFEICQALGCAPNDLAPESTTRRTGTISDFNLLSQKNREMVETMIQALILKQMQDGK